MHGRNKLANPICAFVPNLHHTAFNSIVAYRNKRICCAEWVGLRSNSTNIAPSFTPEQPYLLFLLKTNISLLHCPIFTAIPLKMPTVSFIFLYLLLCRCWFFIKPQKEPIPFFTYFFASQLRNRTNHTWYRPIKKMDQEYGKALAIHGNRTPEPNAILWLQTILLMKLQHPYMPYLAQTNPFSSRLTPHFNIKIAWANEDRYSPATI